MTTAEVFDARVAWELHAIITKRAVKPKLSLPIAELDSPVWLSSGGA